MYHSWDAHDRHINVLKFTHDGAALISGSEDSGVSVWSVARFVVIIPCVMLLTQTVIVRLVDNDAQNELPTPYCTLSDHTLPVKDIICGLGAFPTCRVLTASLDHSVKVSHVFQASVPFYSSSAHQALGPVFSVLAHYLPLPKTHILDGLGHH